MSGYCFLESFLSTYIGTSWSPSTYVGHFHRNSEKIRESSREMRSKSFLKNQRSKELDKRTQSNDSIDIIFNKNQNEKIIKNLQDHIVKQETNHENHIKEIRNEYQTEINELKDKLNYLKNPSLNENNSELIHEKHREQEKLIKAYQLENENLYSDLKILKEKYKLENKNFIEQIKALAFLIENFKKSHEY